MFTVQKQRQSKYKPKLRQRQGGTSKNSRAEELAKVRVAISQVSRRTREANNLTQVDIADRIGVSEEFYARIERGMCWPSIRTFARLVIALGVQADVLLGLKPADHFVSTPIQDIEDERSEIRRVSRLLRRAQPRTLRLVKRLLVAIDGW